MTEPTDVARFLTTYTIEEYGTYARYEFPNGRGVRVEPDPDRALRFQIEVLGPGGRAVPNSTVEPGLTTEQVEARLREVRDLPPAAPDPT